MRPQVLSSAVVVQDKLLDPLELFLGGNDHQAAAHAVGNDLRLCAVRRNLVVEQVFCQLDQFLGIAILKPQQSHLSFDRFGGCGDGGHDLFNDLELLLGRGHDKAAPRFVRQGHRPGQTGKFRVLHPLINQLLDRLDNLVELALLPARQADRAHLPQYNQRPSGLVFLKECSDASVLIVSGQDDQLLAARVLDNLRCRPGAWLVVLKQPHDQWHHLAGLGALKVHKPHRALRRVREHVKRLHHLLNHLVLLDVGSDNHPVIRPVLNQSRLRLVTKRCFGHAVIHQRLDIAVNLVHLPVGQGQHCRASRLGLGLGQAQLRDQLRDLQKMIRFGPDNQSLRVLVPQDDRISRTGSRLFNLFLVKPLHQWCDAAKLFTVEHLKDASLAGNNWFPPLLKLPHDVLSGLNITW